MPRILLSDFMSDILISLGQMIGHNKIFEGVTLEYEFDLLSIYLT